MNQGDVFQCAIRERWYFTWNRAEYGPYERKDIAERERDRLRRQDEEVTHGN